MSNTKERLLSDAYTIRDERTQGENSAARVGQLLVDIIDSFATWLGQYVTEDDMEQFISTVNLTDYLKKTDAVNLYLSIEKAERDYLTKVDAENTYVSKVSLMSNYLRKDADDVTEFKLTMNELLVKVHAVLMGDTDFGIFNTGVSGARIDENGDGEMKSLVIRESMTVPELKFNRVTVETGTNWHTVGGGKISRVWENYGKKGTVSAGYGIAMLDVVDGDIGAVDNDDLCQGIFHLNSGNETSDIDDRNGNFKFAGFKTIYFRIVKVITQENYSELVGTDWWNALNVEEQNIYITGKSNRKFFVYRLRKYCEADNRETTYVDVEGKRYTDETHPQPEMSFTQYANPINEDRQKCGYETPEYEILLAGMTGWTYGSTNILYIKGHLNGFNLDCRKWNTTTQQYENATISLSGYGIAYGRAYQWGNIYQFDRKPSLVSQQLYYLANNSSTAPSADAEGWSTDPDTQKISASCKYLWEYWLYTYSDDTTSKSKVFPGAVYTDSQTSMSADLDNEMDTFGADVDGKAEASISSTKISLYYGTTAEVLTNVTAVADQEGVTCTPEVVSGKFTGKVSCSIQANKTFTNDKVLVTITATSARGTMSCVFTLQGIRAAQPGTPATLYKLRTSSTAVKINKQNDYDIYALIVYVDKIVGDTMTENCGEGSIAVSSDGVAKTTISGKNATVSVITYKPTKNIKLILTVNGKIYDTETIPIVADGFDGKNAPNENILDGSKNYRESNPFVWDELSGSNGDDYYYFQDMEFSLNGLTNRKVTFSAFTDAEIASSHNAPTNIGKVSLWLKLTGEGKTDIHYGGFTTDGTYRALGDNRYAWTKEIPSGYTKGVVRVNNYSNGITPETSRWWNFKVELGEEVTDWCLSENDKRGADAILIDLDNEMDSIPCDSDGKVMVETTVITNARLYKGSTQITTGITGNAGSICGALVSSQVKSGGVLECKWHFGVGDTISSFDKDTATVNIIYGGNTHSAVMTVNVVKSGAPGVAPDIYKLSLGSYVVKVGKNSTTCEPSSFAVSGIKINGSGVTNLTFAQLNAAGYDIRYSIGVNGSWETSTNGVISSYNSSSKVVNIALCKRLTATTWRAVDSESIPVILDGSDGKGILPNLFGYNSIISNSYSMHTANGFVVFEEAGSKKYVQAWWRNGGVADSNKFPAGTYSLSGKLVVSGKYLPSTFSVSVFADDSVLVGSKFVANGVQSTGSQTITGVSSGQIVDFSVKFRSNGSTTPYIIVQGLLSSSYAMLTVSNLKMEETSAIDDLCTPFDGLAPSENILGTNIFTHSSDFMKDWHNTGVNSIVMIPNYFQGNSAVKYVGGSFVDPTWGNCNFLYQSIKFVDSVYTVSWWQKGKGRVTVFAQLATQGYSIPGSVIVKDGTDVSYNDGESASAFYDLSNDWVFHTLTFKANNPSSQAYIRWSAERDYNISGNDIYIAMPKIEQGDHATSWQLCEIDRMGSSISTISEEYAYGTASAPTGTWGTTQLTPNETNQYVWNREVITLTDGTTKTTTAHVSCIYGKSIKSYSESYAVNNDGSTPTSFPYTSITSAVAVMSDENRYLWNKEVITYSNNTTSQNVHLICVWGESGNGVDGAQPNMFGYDSDFKCLYNFHSIAHTPTGLAAYLELDDDPDSGNRFCLIRCKNIITSNGIYSVSGYVTTNVNNNMEFDVCDSSCIAGNNRIALTANVRTRFEAKFRVSNYSSSIYNFVDIEFSGGGLVVIDHLKIEEADELTGVCTKYNGLAPDSIAQGLNLLKDTGYFTKQSVWRNYHGTITKNAMDSMSSFKYTNNGSVYVEMLEQDITNLLLPNTWYTLSYYAKCKGTCYSHVYPMVQGYASLPYSINTVSIEQLTNDYPFTQVEYGCWKAGAIGVSNGVSNMKVVLRNSSSAAVTVPFYYEIVSEANYDYGYISTVQSYSSYSDVKNNAENKLNGTGNGYVNITIPANSNKTIYIGYCKDGSGNATNEKFMVGIGTIIHDVRIVDGVGQIGAPDEFHVIEESTEWVKHSVVFKTSPSLTGMKYALWRVMPGASLEIAMPKLERGQKPTQWQFNESDRSGAMLRPCGIWSSTAEYVYNMEFCDVVIYNDNYYAVANLGNNPPMGTVPTNTTYWVEANKMRFVATDLLLAQKAYINNLVSQEVSVADENHNKVCDINSNVGVKVYDNSFAICRSDGSPMIQAGLDDNGIPQLLFYDASGQVLYNLGIGGIKNINTIAEKWVESKWKQLTTSSNISSVVNVKDTDCSTFYTFYNKYTVNGNSTIAYYKPGGSTMYTASELSGNRPAEYGKSFVSRSLSANPQDGWFIEPNYGQYMELANNSASKEGIYFIQIIPFKNGTKILSMRKTVYFKARKLGDTTQGYIECTYDGSSIGQNSVFKQLTEIVQPPIID